MLKGLFAIGLYLGIVSTSIAGTQMTKDGIKFPDGSEQTSAGLPRSSVYGSTGMEGATRISDALNNNWNSSMPSGFYEGNDAANAPKDGWLNLINVRHSNQSNNHGFQLAMPYTDNDLWYRSYSGGTGGDDGTFREWQRAQSNIGRNNWTRLGYGTSGDAYWHKLATIEVVSHWTDYNAQIEWVSRYNYGTLNIHVHSNANLTPVIWNDNVNFSGKYSASPKSIGDFVYTVSGSRIEIWIRTPGWRVFSYKLQDSVTQSRPVITWYEEGTATKQPTEPAGKIPFKDYNSVSRPISTGTLTSLVPENDNILKWSNNGYLRRITNQGGAIMSADSSLVLHAGDHHNYEDADLGIIPTTTRETLWLTSDGEVKVITNWQDGIANAKTWTFKRDGRLMAPDGNEISSGGGSGTSGSDWVKLPNGLIIQWGVTSGLNSVASCETVTLPVAFTTTTYSVTTTGTAEHSGATRAVTAVKSLTTTSMSVCKAAFSGNLRWTAIGF